MSPKTLVPALFLLLVGAAQAQPVVGQGGVLNAASFTRDGLPGDGIARGGMFVVFGQGMGPAGLVQSSAIPLTTELAGTSVTVTVGGTSVAPFLLFTSSGQLAAVLPSNTPEGAGTLTVTFGGQTSAPVAVKVVENGFGIFTRNQAGFGPAILQNFISQTEAPLNALNQAAQPDQVVILWGTGLGPIQASDAALPPVGSLPYQVDVILNGTTIVQPFYAGRSPQFPGIDQINFTLPQGLDGCYVSIAIRVNGVISNYATIAVSPQGRFCSGPLSAEEIMLAEQQGSLRVGSVTLVNGGGLEPTVETEAGQYSLDLLNQSTLSFVALETHLGQLGSCMVGPTFMDFFPVDPLEPAELLGGDLTVTSPAGTIVDPDELPLDFFPPGLVTISAEAGPQVPAFEVSMTLPPVGTLVSPTTLPAANRAQGLSVRWAGVDASTDFVLILGRSENQPAQAGRTFFCTADASRGEFTIPPEVMLAVPASVAAPGAEDPAGILLVGTGTKATVGSRQVDGIDAAYFVALQILGFVSPNFQ